eukprot:CAMPEP_0167764266 /NCGR_PEP_ID=MMETSP0110_2-20121227/13918_1 /TAXON_ID=629695 /ORGANISM="Gymnochlora sp., Strain CCMP2014" /LENGTH=910 /DNA_ID=CAMNT_0007651613 /DNA_START=1 /DNA_END=2733 /DNA_ORIENTATION=-
MNYSVRTGNPFGTLAPRKRRNKKKKKKSGNQAAVAVEAKRSASPASPKRSEVKANKDVLKASVEKNLAPAQMIQKLDPSEADAAGFESQRHERRKLLRNKKQVDNSAPVESKSEKNGESILMKKLKSLGVTYSSTKINKAYQSLKKGEDEPSIEDVLKEIQAMERKELLRQLKGSSDEKVEEKTAPKEAAKWEEEKVVPDEKVEEPATESVEAVKVEPKQPETKDDVMDIEEELKDEKVDDVNVVETTAKIDSTADEFEALKVWNPASGPTVIRNILRKVEGLTGEDRRRQIIEILQKNVLELATEKLLLNIGEAPVWKAFSDLVKITMKGNMDDHKWFVGRLKQMSSSLKDCSTPAKNEVLAHVRSNLAMEKKLKTFELDFESIHIQKEKVEAEEKARFAPDQVKIDSNDHVGLIRGKYMMSKAYAESREQWFRRVQQLLKSLNQSAVKRQLDLSKNSLQLKTVHLSENLKIVERKKSSIAEEKLRKEGSRMQKLKAMEMKVQTIKNQKNFLLAERRKLLLQISRIDSELESNAVAEKETVEQLKKMSSAENKTLLDQRLEHISLKVKSLSSDVQIIEKATNFLVEMRDRRLMIKSGAWNVEQETKALARFGAEYLHGMKIHLRDIFDFTNLVKQRRDFCKKQISDLKKRQQEYSSFGIFEDQSGVANKMRVMLEKDSKELANLSLSAYNIVQSISKTMNPLHAAVAPAFIHFFRTLQSSNISTIVDIKKLESIHEEYMMRSYIQKVSVQQRRKPQHGVQKQSYINGRPQFVASAHTRQPKPASSAQARGASIATATGDVQDKGHDMNGSKNIVEAASHSSLPGRSLPQRSGRRGRRRGRGRGRGPGRGKSGSQKFVPVRQNEASKAQQPQAKSDMKRRASPPSSKPPRNPWGKIPQQKKFSVLPSSEN